MGIGGFHKDASNDRNQKRRCSENRDVIFTRTRTEEAADRRSSQRQKDGRDDADAGGRKLHESPAIIALVDSSTDSPFCWVDVDSSTDSPFCWVDRRFPDARTLDFLVRSSKSTKSVSSPSTRSCYDLFWFHWFLKFSVWFHWFLKFLVLIQYRFWFIKSYYDSILVLFQYRFWFMLQVLIQTWFR